MDSTAAREFALTVQLGGWGIDDDVAGCVLAELAHLRATPSPAPVDTVAFDCVVTAGCDLEAVAYASTRAVAVLLAHGVASPHVLSVEVGPFARALV
jgi:hypothetical protein